MKKLLISLTFVLGLSMPVASASEPETTILIFAEWNDRHNTWMTKARRQGNPISSSSTSEVKVKLDPHSMQEHLNLIGKPALIERNPNDYLERRGYKNVQIVVGFNYTTYTDTPIWRMSSYSLESLDQEEVIPVSQPSGRSPLSYVRIEIEYQQDIYRCRSADSCYIDRTSSNKIHVSNDDSMHIAGD